uniref:Uncharacterized protein n=1 Tax=Ditylenchus dipsaci TaxID=166011 RepID=A0A915DWY7_9BILA
MSDNTLKTQAKRKAIKTSDESEDKFEKQMAPALKKPKKNKSSGLSTEVYVTYLFCSTEPNLSISAGSIVSFSMP